MGQWAIPQFLALRLIILDPHFVPSSNLLRRLKSFVFCFVSCRRKQQQAARSSSFSRVFGQRAPLMPALASLLARPCAARRRFVARAATATPAFAAPPDAPPATVRDRAKAALLGAILADAATMPLHCAWSVIVQ